MEIDAKAHLFDMRWACERILAFTGGSTLEAYEANDLVRSAVERQLEIVGEAANRLRRSDPPLFEWLPWSHAIIGLRNRLAHGYETIDDAIIWNIVVEAIPALRIHLDTELDEHPGDGGGCGE